MAALIISCFVLLVGGLIVSGLETFNGRKWAVRPSRLCIAASALCALFAVSLAFHDPEQPIQAQASTVSRPVAAVRQTPQTRLATCRQLMDDADKKLSAWKTWRRIGDRVNVVIGPGYYLADTEGRAAFDSVVRCVATDGGSDELAQVNYIDYRTHRRLAEWDKATGFHVN